MTNGPGGQLQRTLGLLDAVGIGVGAIVGAGIFVVLGVAAGIAGPAVILAVLVAGMAATANALSSAQLAATYPVTGGTYEYGYRVLGPWRGFVAGWMFLAGKTAGVGTVALGIGAYLETVVPGVPARAVAATAVVVFTALNYTGVRRSSAANLVIVALSVMCLLLFLALGFPDMREAAYTPFAPAGWGATLEAAALMFFAYTGYARIATLGEEVRDPQRTIPRAIIITISTTLALYAAVAVVAVGVVGAPALADTGAPLQVAATAAGGATLGLAVTVGGTAAMLGVILSQLLGLSRMGFAMARRGDLPRFLDRVHPRFGVPHRAVVLIGVVALVVTLTGTLKGVASAAAFTILVYYGIANWAALRMPREAKLFPDLVPVAGCVACGLLALSLSSATLLTGLMVLLGGVVARLVINPRTGQSDAPA
ncbi:MAG: amino acid permease [Gemmatimonadota bacterium]|nr:amino acid permease [Gemmatimonadota bacterium]